MNHLRIIIYTGLAMLSLAALPAAAMAADIEALTADCDSCHGKDGASKRSETPIIGGLSAFFIEDTFFVYKDKARPCVEAEYIDGAKKGEVTDMCAIAAELNEEQIAALAEHYSALPFVPADQSFDAAKVPMGKEVHERQCEKCHALGGTDPLDDAGLLGGQWTPYLRESLEFFRNGERESDEKMIDKVKGLSSEEIDALLNYYASLKDAY